MNARNAERKDKAMTKFTYEDIGVYVNQSVAAYAEQIANIESVRCNRRNDEVYIELIHEDGTTRYFDVSDMSVSQIGIMFGHIIANRPIRCEIRDRTARKEIRKLFN